MNTQRIITNSLLYLLACCAISLCWFPVAVSAQAMVFDVEFAGRDQDYSRNEVRAFGDIRVDPTLDFSVDNLEANLFFVHDSDQPVSLPSRAIDFDGNSTSEEVLQWELSGDELFLTVNPASFPDQFSDDGETFFLGGELLLFRERSPQSEFWEIQFGSNIDFDTGQFLPSILLLYDSNDSIPNPAIRAIFDVPLSSGNRIKVGTLRPTLLGDANLDGEVTFADIPSFIAALQAGTFLSEADVNEDGEVSFADIPAFIEILQAG